MHVFRARNVHQAALEVACAVVEQPELTHRTTSRNGDVRVFSEPVSTCYENPLERVIFWPERNANPFFHLLESLWMLAGRNDVAYIGGLLKRMHDYSDDGETLHGAYGYRWRCHFGEDQLARIAESLRKNPADRRQVLAMWDARSDLFGELGGVGKDLPCNLLATFTRGAGGELNMMVANRSNDVVWGAYGANAVHFSYLQEYVANRIGCPVGKYWQVSSNFHIYDATWRLLEPITEDRGSYPCPYSDGSVAAYPLGADAPTFDAELHAFLDEGKCDGKVPFFRDVAQPLAKAREIWKQEKDAARALHAAGDCKDSAWQRAAREWIGRADQRRKLKK